jgi:hypothetical protein
MMNTLATSISDDDSDELLSIRVDEILAQRKRMRVEVARPEM